MAMNFIGANRAQMPDYMAAHLKDAEIRNQIRQAEQQRRLGYATAGADLAGRVPQTKWADLGNAIIGQSAAPATAGEAAMASTVVDPLTGAVASGVPEAATAGSELLGAGAMQSAAPSAAMGAEAAGAAEAAMAATEGAAAVGSGAGAGGVSGALGALGPIGWLALLGFGLAATDAFG